MVKHGQSTPAIVLTSASLVVILVSAGNEMHGVLGHICAHIG